MNELLRRLLFLPAQASTVAFEIDTLHYFVIGATMLGSAAVFGIALLFIIRYRRRRENEPTESVRPSLARELVMIGGTLLLFIVWWVVGFRQYVRLQVPPDGALDVYVTAKQWMWKFAYADGRNALKVLTVPVGRPVRLVMTSRDVIHSFYVPAFRIKMDVLPGRYTTAWFEATKPGAYDVFCTEYCGVSHSNMIAVVVVLSVHDYEEWLARASAEERSDLQAEAPPGLTVEEGTSTNLADIGRRVASRRQCLACHTLDGQRHIGPTWRGLYGRTVQLTDGRRLRADEGYLTRSMMDPRVDVVATFEPVMPSYRGILEAPEVAALLELMRSLRDSVDEPDVSVPAVPPMFPAPLAPSMHDAGADVTSDSAPVLAPPDTPGPVHP